MTRTKNLFLIVFFLCSSVCVGATWTVNTVADNNLGNAGSRTGSLRYCIAHASSGDVIEFDPITDGSPIVLTNGVINVFNKSLEIYGNGRDQTIVDGNNAFQIMFFNYPNVGNLKIEGLSIRNGFENGSSPVAAIEFVGQDFIVDNCDFYDHSGLVIRMRASVFNLVSSKVFNNSSLGTSGNSDTGILVFGNSTDVVVESSSIYNNGALTDAYTGLAIYETGSNGQAIIRNSTISGNRGISLLFQGSGSNNYPVKIISSDIIENRIGGSLSNHPFLCSFGVALEVSNSVIAKNVNVVSGQETNVHLFNATFASLGYNLFGETSGINSNLLSPTDLYGTVQNPLDPMLSSLGNYGGPTPTHIPLNGSPVLDSGDPALIGTNDQRGFARSGNGQVDRGAVEFQLASFTGGAFQRVCQGTCFKAEVDQGDFQYQTGIAGSFVPGVPTPINVTSPTTVCVYVGRNDVNLSYDITDAQGQVYSSPLLLEVRKQCASPVDVCCQVGGGSSNKVSSDPGFTVFPNPVIDENFTIELGEAYKNESFFIVEITDLTGLIVYSKTVSGSVLYEAIEIVVSSLKKGICSVRLRNEIVKSSQLITVE